MDLNLAWQQLLQLSQSLQPFHTLSSSSTLPSAARPSLQSFLRETWEAHQESKETLLAEGWS